VTVVIDDLGRCAFSRAHRHMRDRLDRLHAGNGPEAIVAFESDPVITLGRNTRSGSLRARRRDIEGAGIPVVEVERGGDATWHGPGQLVLFPLIDIEGRGTDVYGFIDLLKEAVGETLVPYGIRIDPPGGEVGVWVGGRKIANIGLRLRRGIVSHGISLNVNPDFGWVDLIHPCGDAVARLTSLGKLVDPCPSLEAIKTALLQHIIRHLEDAPIAITGKQPLPEPAVYSD
jgi:lipoate-protein ligase B